jgi:diguanylate cyclase (GGDEF)-like protein
MPQELPELTDALFADYSTLVTELERVIGLAESAADKKGTAHTRLVLLRFVEGLDLVTWRSISGQATLEHWFAMPLNETLSRSLFSFQKALETLLYQCDHDALTGLSNRRLFDARLRMEVERAYRTQTDLSVVMLDLDDFKTVNDIHGHLMGDVVLKRLGGLLNRELRAYDVAARIGGEEFCLILPGSSGAEAQRLTTRLLELFRQEEFSAPDSSQFRVTFSAGVATVAAHAAKANMMALLDEADKALYAAKRGGKNRVAATGALQTLAGTPGLVRAEEKKFLFAGGG